MNAIAPSTRRRAMRILIVQPGTESRGGVSADVGALADSARTDGDDVRVVGTVEQAAQVIAGRPDVVHLFGCLPSSVTFGSMAFARRRRVPIVWTPVFHPSRVHSWRGYGWRRAMAAFDRAAPRCARWTDAVLASTDAEAALFRTLGAPRVELVPPAVEFPVLEPTSEDIAAFRARFAIPAGRTLLVVGRQNSRKGLPFAAEVFARVRAALPDAAMVLAGPTGDAGGGILPLGWLPPIDLACAYRAADLIFVSSLYESFSRTVIEAWANVRPVVVTDRVGLAPVVAASGGGEVVAYGDAVAAAGTIASLLDDKGRRERMATAGQGVVKARYALRATVDATRSVYRDLSHHHESEAPWMSR